MTQTKGWKQKQKRQEKNWKKRSRQHSANIYAEDDLIEIWEYSGETRGRCIVREKETEIIDCYKRAIDELKNYKQEREEREHGRSAAMAG